VVLKIKKQEKGHRLQNEKKVPISFSLSFQRGVITCLKRHMNCLQLHTVWTEKSGPSIFFLCKKKEKKGLCSTSNYVGTAVK
jgi:hypothetical protein